MVPASLSNREGRMGEDGWGVEGRQKDFLSELFIYFLFFKQMLFRWF